MSIIDEKFISESTGLGPEQRKHLCVRYCSLDESARVEVHRRQRELFRDWVADGRMPPKRGGESNYSAMIVALHEMFSSVSAAKSASGGARPRKQRKQRLRSSLEKRFMGELVRLREEQNMSWRQIGRASCRERV